MPDADGTPRVVQSNEFLSARESQKLLERLAQPTPGISLERFIWEFEKGNTKQFAAKVEYHPNRISALKSSSRAISLRLFRRMAKAYNLSEKERDFWARQLLDI